MPRLYKPRNVLAVSASYVATAGLVGGAFLLGGPILLGASALLVGGISVFSIRAQKNFMEKKLVRHPDVHQFSPELGKTVEHLYKASGLKADNYPIYDFRADPAKTKKKKGFMEEMMEKTGKTHQAAAMRFGKPVIMISEPLLKLLDTKEEKAVLAHEFAHAAARHMHFSLPQRLIGGTAAASAQITKLVAFLSTGLGPVVYALGSGMGAKIVTRMAHKNRKLNFKKEKNLSLMEIAKKKKMRAITGKIGGLVTLGVAAYLSPAYLPIAAAAIGLGAAASVANGLLSRSMEYQADAGAVKLGADPLALVTALRKLETVQKNSVKAAFGGELPKAGKLTKVWAGLTASHPATKKRVKRLSKLAKKAGASEDQIKRATNDPVEVSADNNMSYETVRSLMAL